MIGVSESSAAIWVAGIAALGGITSSLIAYMNRRGISTGNGHTIGRGVARIEDQMRDHENRLDRIEVHTVEQFSDIKESLSESKQDRARIKFDLERHHTTYKHERKMVDE